MIDVVEIGEADLPRLVALRSAVSALNPISPAGYVDWRRQAEDMAWLLAIEDGRDVGAGHGIVGWHSTPGTGAVEAWTRPDARGRGVGHTLYAALLEWAGDRGCIAVDTAVAEDDAASLGWAERRGFRRAGTTSSRALDLGRLQAPDVAPPEGIEIVTWAARPGIERGLYAVYVEGAPDVPGQAGIELPTFERWLANDMRGRSDHPEAVFAALARDEVVGYAKLAYGENHGGTAWHDLVAVKRAWRGRGVAGALKRAQIAFAKEHGFERLRTRNDRDNTPVVRLNDRLGYAVEPGRILLHTMIAGSD